MMFLLLLLVTAIFVLWFLLWLAVLITKLIHSLRITGIHKPLVDKEHKDDIITQSHQFVFPGHLDQQSEDIINDSLEEFVKQSMNWKMSDGVELVVDVELRDHRDKAEVVDGVHESVECPEIPRGVAIGVKVVDGKTKKKRKGGEESVETADVVIVEIEIGVTRGRRGRS